METPDKLTGDLNSTSDPEVTEPDTLAADGHDLPPDPLLQPGSFIDASPGAAAQWPTGSEPSVQDGDRESDKNELDLNADNATPPPLKNDAKSTPTRKRGASLDAAESVPETPQWLPEGWKMVCKVRSSGATAGSIDRYYLEPLTGKRFRSKKEVDYFIETGTKRKRILPTDADAAADTSESTGARKQKRSGSATKKPPLNFDFNSVPEIVCWKLKDAPSDQWMPFMDGKMVSKLVKQDWDAAFQSLSTNNSFKPL